MITMITTITRIIEVIKIKYDSIPSNKCPRVNIRRWGLAWFLVFMIFPAITSTRASVLGHAAINSQNVSMSSIVSSTAALKIMTTTTVPRDIVFNIGGNLVDVEAIVNGATDIHTFQGPTLNQIEHLAQANVTFCMGNISAGLTDLEPWLPVTNSTLGGIRIVPLIQAAMIKPDPALDNANNPHAWLDPSNVKLMASTVTAELISLDPLNAPTYEANNATYQAKLDLLLNRVQAARIASLDGEKVVARHPAFTYLFDLLGINQVAIIEKVEGQEPSQTWINTIINLMRSEQVPIFVGQPQLNLDEIYSVARDAGVKVALLTDMPGITLGNGTTINTYIAMIDYNIDALLHPFDPPAQPVDAVVVITIALFSIAAPLTVVVLAARKKIHLAAPRHFHHRVAPLVVPEKKAIIELDHVSVVLGKTNVLRDISLKIDKGEYVGLIGKNGSGKSTLIKTILGLYKPASGTIKVFGEQIHGRTYERIGYTPQMHAISHEFPATVGDVVAMGLYKKKGLISHMTRDDLERVTLALHKVKMEAFINRPIGHLSGGEQQKVLIAQALVRDPDILLLDEPTSALDHVIVKDILAMLEDLNKTYGITLIVIQHNMELLLPFCSRLIMLRRSIVFDGKTDAPRLKDAMRETFA
jgi:zinc transport system ATP-binding protein